MCPSVHPSFPLLPSSLFHSVSLHASAQGNTHLTFPSPLPGKVGLLRLQAVAGAAPKRRADEAVGSEPRVGRGAPPLEGLQRGDSTTSLGNPCWCSVFPSACPRVPRHTKSSSWCERRSTPNGALQACFSTPSPPLRWVCAVTFRGAGSPVQLPRVCSPGSRWVANPNLSLCSWPLGAPHHSLPVCHGH